MPNYLESSVSGTSYRRARKVSVANEYDGNKAILFDEEDVISLADGSIIKRPAGNIVEPFTTENAGTTFQIMNPVTNEPVEGATATYQDVYVTLFSLYYHLAQRRDSEQA